MFDQNTSVQTSSFLWDLYHLLQKCILVGGCNCSKSSQKCQLLSVIINPQSLNTSGKIKNVNHQPLWISRFLVAKLGIPIWGSAAPSAPAGFFWARPRPVLGQGSAWRARVKRGQVAHFASWEQLGTWLVGMELFVYWLKRPSGN